MKITITITTTTIIHTRITHMNIITTICLLIIKVVWAAWDGNGEEDEENETPKNVYFVVKI
jgi:hypothetical protein